MDEYIQQFSDFFQHRLTLLDFLIIGLGTILVLYQSLKRITTFSKGFYRKAQESPLFITREKLKLRYISSLIEILPVMGIMGTVWGLMKALYFISKFDRPKISDIAVHIAPALSTTFFALLFAVINLFIFNFLYTYYAELIAWCYLNGVTKVETEEKEDETA